MPGLKRLALAGLAAALFAVAFLWLGSDSASASPTCADALDVAVHGQHVIGDYVTGVGRGSLDWPPSGGIVGEETGGEGVAIAGGPGPGFHFQQNPPFAPGAAVCVPQSKAPGVHF